MILNSKDFVVYTCITGSYESKPSSHILDNNVRYVCFSDNQASVPIGWEFKCIKNLNHLDNKDKNRYIKMHPHIFLDNYEISIYIDYNIKIIKKLTDLFLKIDKSNGSIHMYEHPFRKCSYEEIKVTIKEGLTTFREGNKQYKKYKREKFPKNFGLFEANIIVRKNQEETTKLMKLWWKEYLSSSKRDQTCLMYASYKIGIKIHSLGNSNLRKGGEYFHLELSKRIRNLKSRVKNIIIRVCNSIFIFIKDFNK